MEPIPSTSSDSEETTYIAKLFRRNDSSDWEELLVGECCIIERNAEQKGILICGLDEEKEKYFYFVIDASTRFEGYEEMLLLWKNEFFCFSLSFTEQTHRDAILNQIRLIQQQIPGCEGTFIEKDLELPPVSVENLESIYSSVTNADISQKEMFHTLLSENNFKYMRDLLDLFPTLESAHNMKSILILLNLCRLIMELGYDDAVSVLFSEDCYEHFFGLMEYKPELPTKANFRAILNSQVHYRNTMTSIDAPLLAHIHKLYRLIYYRDAVDPQPIDDTIPSSLTSQIADTIKELLHAVCTNSSFVTELLNGLDGPDEMSLHVLQELFLHCKDMTSGEKESLVRSLEQQRNAFTSLLEKRLETNPTPLVFSTLEYRIAYATDSYRQFVVSHSHASSLSIICTSFCEASYEIQLICNSILHHLLSSDPLNSLPNSRLYDQFIRLFYENYVAVLFPCIFNATPAASLVLNLLGDYEKSHGTNVQFILLKNNLFPAILQLLESPNRCLQLACIQFMSRCLSSTLSWYRRFIIKRNYLEPLFVYANQRLKEDSLVMSAFYHLLVVCFATPGTDIAEYARSKLQEYPDIASLPIVCDLVNVRRGIEEPSAKMPRIESN